jgi:c-di-GMP-binding flagellar brake protein YcgR
MFNRRVHVRVHPSKGEPVAAQISGDDFMDEFDVRDISAGGIGVVAEHVGSGVTINAQIEMVIKLPRERAFVARGIIRHISRQGMLGIEFTQLAHNDRQRVEQYVARRVGEGGRVAV